MRCPWGVARQPGYERQRGRELRRRTMPDGRRREAEDAAAHCDQHSPSVAQQWRLESHHSTPFLGSIRPRATTVINRTFRGGFAMRLVHPLMLLGLLAVSRIGAAQAVFNGTWRPDPEMLSPTRKADAFELVNGVYECRTCAPPYKVMADNTDQPITGDPYYDTVRVKVIDDRTIQKVAMKDGKTAMEMTSTVSADGKHRTDVQTNNFMAPRPVELTMHSTRLSAGPNGSHAISGEWRMTDLDVSNHAEDTIFSVSGVTFSMSDRMGRSFSAKLDGSDAPYIGSDEFTSVSLTKIDDHTIEELDKKDGKVVKINRWSVASDGKTIHVRFDDTHGHVQESDGRKVQ